MKKLMTGLLGMCLCVAGFAQTVTIAFRGNQSANYRVMIDGVRYYSSNASTSNVYNTSFRTPDATNQRTLNVTNLNPGAHRLEIYNIAGANSSTGGQLVYTNNFQLRSEYDMMITVNGQRITFSEKINPTVNANGQYRTAISAAGFQQVMDRVRQNRYQDGRIAAIRTALNSADYFTTDQINQLLTLVNSESARLDLAKTAYARASDPANYSELNTLFDSQTSINNLSDYTRVNSTTNVNTNTSGSATVTGRVLLTASAYDRLLQDLNSNNYQSGKYNIINSAFSNSANAFTTTQIRQLLGAITSEPDRLYLAKQSYGTVSDPANFSTLITLFPTQSNRENLNTFIVSSGGTGNNSLVVTKASMSDASFNTILRSASSHIRPSSKYDAVKAAFSNPDNNFSSTQVRQLMSVLGTTTGSLLSVSEANRLELAKLSFARVTDPGNFSTVVDLFDRQTSRDDLTTYLRSTGNY